MTATPTRTPRRVMEARFSAEEARELTEQVRREASTLWLRVLELYEGGAHIALGYGSWRRYWEGEFGGSGARGEQMIRAGRVARALVEAGLPLPANDTTARQLVPVLNRAPEDLPAIWQRAVDAHGQPTGRQVRDLVEPYRKQPDRAPHSTRNDPADYERRGYTRRTRGVVAHALEQARGAAELVRAGLVDALLTDPEPERVHDWLEQAQAAHRALGEVLESLEARLE